MRYLDIAHPSLTERVGPGTEGVQTAKFVRIDIVAVTNPRDVALSFNVFFKPDNSVPRWLGTFGPYPADNRGQFIVPTKGLVRAGGSIVISMKIPQDAAGSESASIRVAVGRISLVP